MEPVAAQLLGTGLATVGVGLSAVGVGIIYATNAPNESKRTGLLVTAGFGVACLLLALTMLFR
jgi:hypothetical protein